MAKNYLKKNPLEKKVTKIKENTLYLYANGCIPSYLAYFIKNCDLLSHTEDFVLGLEEITAHAMRVKGYYKKYCQIEKEMSKTCKESIDRMLKEERR